MWRDKIDDCKLGLYQDASLAEDLQDSKSNLSAHRLRHTPDSFFVCSIQGYISRSGRAHVKVPTLLASARFLCQKPLSIATTLQCLTASRLGCVSNLFFAYCHLVETATPITSRWMSWACHQSRVSEPSRPECCPF